METMKKIYSVNLAAFVYLVSKIEPRIGFDWRDQAFFLFPDDTSISLIINVYRNNRVSVDLKDYLSAFKYIRTLMSKAKAARNGK